MLTSAYMYGSVWNHPAQDTLEADNPLIHCPLCIIFALPGFWTPPFFLTIYGQ